jgi:hypothetical protein
MIYPAARATAFSADSVPDGQMRAVEKRDSNGQKIIEWIGKTSFIKDMTRPGRRVLGFLSGDGHYYNTSGRYIR